MYSHVFIGVNDFERAYLFYQPLMAALGLKPRFCDRSRPWAGWQTAQEGRPLFLIGAPYDGEPASAGNGNMTAFEAQDRATVDAVYATALAHGGSDAGEPGLRTQYHADYYGAYFRDPEGNKLCVVCHARDPAAEVAVRTL